MDIPLTIHFTGRGSCSVTGTQGNGHRFTLHDGSFVNVFFCAKAFNRLMKMRQEIHEGDSSKILTAATEPPK